MNEMESEISITMTTREEENRPEISSPSTTADHICRRLLRPSSLLRSQPPPSAIASLEEKKTATKKKKKRLEDYLNPALLAEISSKIRRPKKVKDSGNESNWRNSEGEVVDLRDDSDPPMFDKSCNATQFQQFENMVSAIRDFPGK